MEVYQQFGMDDYYGRRNKDEAIYGCFAYNADGRSQKRCFAYNDDGLSRKRSKLISETHLSKPLKFVSSGENDDDDDKFLPTDFWRKIKEGAQRRRRQDQSAFINHDHESSNSSTSATMSNVAMRMMAKMGYRAGTGLGKNHQGIITNIEVYPRYDNAGIGYKDDQPPPHHQKMPQPPRECLWSKKNQKKKKNKVPNMTPEELLLSKVEKPLVANKVIDIRDPQVCLLTSLVNLNKVQPAEETQSPFRELKHNMQLLTFIIKDDFNRTRLELQHKRESLHLMERERDRLQEKAAHEKGVLHLMATIDTQLKLAGTQTLDSLLNTFKDLNQRFQVEYKLYDLQSIACYFAHPLLMQLFQGWEPLEKPLHGFKLMSSWRDFLQDTQTSSQYAQLFGEVVLPPQAAISLIDKWQAREPEPMLQFLEMWDGVMPPPLMQAILNAVVVPKLSAAVEMWDPMQETVPIHVWVHPWLPLLGQRLEPLCHTICFKLGSVLHSWHASEAYAILSPWKDVFDASSWELLTVRYIVPKLMTALRETQIINPTNPILDQFNWVMLWAPIIPVQYMVTMLEVEFFSRWHQVLYHWLCSNPNFIEVSQWYLGWKNLFPQELLANEQIRTLLYKGLDMMNQAVEGMEVVQPGAREKVKCLRVAEKREFNDQKKAATFTSYQHSSIRGVPGDETGNTLEMGFKEMIQAYAVELGLLFLPKVGRSYNGLQVYKLGNVSICIDSVKQLLLAKRQDGWGAVSLTELLDLQHHSCVHN